MVTEEAPAAGLPALVARARALAEVLLALEPELVETGEIPKAALPALQESGLLGLTLPERHGGLGRDILASVSVHAELCRVPAVFLREFRTAAGAGTRMLLNHGSRQQQDRWLPDIAAGRVLAGFALSEPHAGSDAAAIRTVATRVPGGWRLDGVKPYIARDVGVISVLAYTDRAAGAKAGVSAFLVEPSAPGLRFGPVTKTMAFEPDYVAPLYLENCFVPESALIGTAGQGFVYAMECLDENRLNIAAAALAQADFALKLSAGHARSRQAFGQSLSEFQAVEHMIAQMMVDVEVSRTVLFEAARSHAGGARSRVLTPIVKLFCTEAAGRVVDTALQIHGGTGYCRGNPIERLYREVRLLRIVEGASEVQKNIIARAGLKSLLAGATGDPGR